MPVLPEVRYLVLPDSTNPYLLARVRWPDVAQAITAGCPEWLDDPGLFDLSNSPVGVTVTFEQAAMIAASWGVRLSSDETFHASGPSLIRRMPADWSNLAPAEIRAWSLDFVDTRRRADSSRENSRARGRHASANSRIHGWRWLLGALGRSRRRSEPKPPALAATFADPTTVELAPDDRWGLDIESIPSMEIPDTLSTGAAENGHVPVVLDTDAALVDALESEARSIIDQGAELESPLVREGDVSASPRSVNGTRKATRRRQRPEADPEVAVENMNGMQPSESDGPS
jgi:hypothetical protein